MSARETMAKALFDTELQYPGTVPWAEQYESVREKYRRWADRLASAGYRILGPDDAKLIETALQHASFALDGVVSLDDEDEGKDGGSDTCQHAKRTVDRALRALKGGGAAPQEAERRNE